MMCVGKCLKFWPHDTFLQEDKMKNATAKATLKEVKNGIANTLTKMTVL